MLAALNLALAFAVLGAGGDVLLRRRPSPEGERVPDLHPARLAIRGVAARAAWADGELVARALDRVIAPVPPREPAKEAPPAAPLLEGRVRLVSVLVAPGDPRHDTCILAPRDGAELVVLRVGDSHDAWRCEEIALVGSGPAVVRFVGPGGACALGLARE